MVDLVGNPEGRFSQDLTHINMPIHLTAVNIDNLELKMCNIVLLILRIFVVGAFCM